MDIIGLFPIFMVTFLCQLDWALDSPDNGLYIILVLCVTVFLDEFIIWVDRLSKAACGHTSFNPLKAWKEQKYWVKKNLASLSHCLQSGTAPFSCLCTRTQTETYTIRCLGFWAFRFRLVLYLIACLDFLLAKYRPWDFSFFIITWPNFLQYLSIDRFLHQSLYLSISYWFCFPGESWLLYSHLFDFLTCLVQVRKAQKWKIQG